MRANVCVNAGRARAPAMAGQAKRPAIAGAPALPSNRRRSRRKMGQRQSFWRNGERPQCGQAERARRRRSSPEWARPLCGSATEGDGTRVPEGRRHQGRIHRSETEEEPQGKRSGTRDRWRQRRQHGVPAPVGADGGHLARVRLSGRRVRAEGAPHRLPRRLEDTWRKAARAGTARAMDGGTGDRAWALVGEKAADNESHIEKHVFHTEP